MYFEWWRCGIPRLASYLDSLGGQSIGRYTQYIALYVARICYTTYFV